jgi:hypothetical protein
MRNSVLADQDSLTTKPQLKRKDNVYHEGREDHEGLGLFFITFLNFVTFVRFVVKKGCP